MFKPGFIRLLAVAVASSTLMHAAPVSALAVDPMIEGAKQCTRTLPRYERQYGIPVHLLSAISSTETGRYHKGLGIALPWPWTINAEGKGYYFDTKEEAVAAARRLRAQGVKSMDVGCMQVNLMYHADAFSSLEEAFNPDANVAYAASFLRRLYGETKNWRDAAAAYHSKTPSFGDKYVSRVYDRWYTIIDRVRTARVTAAKSVGGMAANNGMTADEAVAAREAGGAKEKQTITLDYTAPKPVTLAPLRPATYTPPAQQPPRVGQSVRQISVKDTSTGEVITSQPRRERGVLVVRPPVPVMIRPAPVVTTSQMVPTGAAVSAPAPAAQTASAAVPRFIFNE